MAALKVTVCLLGDDEFVAAISLPQKYLSRTDTMWDAPKTGPTVEDVLTTRSNFGGGLACVSNFGDFANYTGHVFAAANAYACGRLAWAPETPSATIDAEWAAMTFPDAPDAAPASSSDASSGLPVRNGSSTS